MVPTFEKKVILRVEHVDCFKQLKISALMRLFQEACAAHTEELGYGVSVAYEKGLYWVIASERLVIHRMPRFGETIRLLCYPGETFFNFFPRQMRVYDEKDNLIIEAASVWCLISIETRTIVNPKDYGAVVQGGSLGNDLRQILSLPCPSLEKKTTAIASYSLSDFNGHLNNTSYADIALDIIPGEYLKKHRIKEFCICFKKEIKWGESFEINYDCIDDTYYFKNDRFVMKIDFE